MTLTPSTLVDTVTSMDDPPNTLGLPLATLDISQPTQEETAVRLPTPLQAKLCEPCKAFLRGDRKEYIGRHKSLNYPECVHHPDAKSFQEAVELPCDICIRLYKAFGRNYGIVRLTETVFNTIYLLFGDFCPQSYSIDRTRYTMYPSIDKDSNHDTKCITYTFRSPGHEASLVLEPYECTKDIL